ncbi:hypothetical protein [Streptomyces sp. UG1]|uniref:hypothetical protein n=1 Tax=Streptomyces sp. UG1 TaxID=3417652 RepID=UPI003CED2EBE
MEPGWGEGVVFLGIGHRPHFEDRALPQTPSRGTPSGRTTGFGRFPSRPFQINAAWLELSVTAVDLLVWAQALLPAGELASAEPKKLRYRLLHAAARITR